MTKFKLSASLIALATAGALASASGCSANKSSGSSPRGQGSSDGSGLNLGGGTGVGPSLSIAGNGAVDSDSDGGLPATCDEAGGIHSYVGCDFWPTIVANPVWEVFDPAVVVANGGMVAAKVVIDGPNAFHQEVTVAPGGLQTVLLKWVADLKGPQFSTVNTSTGRMKNSARVDKGAYHMTSSVPVTAWQFNPLQYTKPACPGITGGESGCRSSSVDASLLLPSTAMTGNYRIFGYSSKNEGTDWGSVPSGAAITATADNTVVTVQLGPKCGTELFPTTDLGVCVSASSSPGVAEQKANDVVKYMMNAGDVVELVAAWAQYPQTKNADLSGSVVNATAPVQVISFNAIAQLPDYSVANADHMEETVLPAEVLGNEYIVVPPTTPTGNAVGHVVRIYGNVDNTHLTYPGTKPSGAPDVLMAGDMVQIPPLPTGQPAADCITVPDHCMVSEPFVVQGDQPFAVASFMVGGTLQMPGTDAMTSQGDPSMTMEVAPAQFRQQYTFLAPADYQENFADVLVPMGAAVTLDGMPLSGAPTAIPGSTWGFVRAKLNNTGTGAHNISTTDPAGLGLQVEGFGFATSYYYPGGLNLKHISEPPVIPVVK
jgi:hypothetical protein